MNRLIWLAVSVATLSILRIPFILLVPKEHQHIILICFFAPVVILLVCWWVYEGYILFKGGKNNV